MAARKILGVNQAGPIDVLLCFSFLLFPSVFPSDAFFRVVFMLSSDFSGLRFLWCVFRTSSIRFDGVLTLD